MFPDQTAQLTLTSAHLVFTMLDEIISVLFEET